MFQILLASLMLGSFCQTAISETRPSTTRPRCTAKVTFVRIVESKQVIVVNSEVIGFKGEPLKAAWCNKGRLTLKLEIQEVPDTTPAMYLARFRLTETKMGKKSVLFEPEIVTAVDTPAKLTVGNEKDNRIEIEVTVREGVSGSDQPKTATADGKTILGSVTPWLIIQDEAEEERLGIQP
jgi:hypothetical protein